MRGLLLIGALLSFFTVFNLLCRWNTRRWIVVKTTFPYREGYGTAVMYRGRKTLMDSGLTKDYAEFIVDAENGKYDEDEEGYY